MKNTESDIVIYETAEGKVVVDVRLSRDTVYLSLNQIASLFDLDKSVISRYLANIFKAEELVLRNEG